MSFLESALRDAGIDADRLDARGLLPVDAARAILESASIVDRDSLDAIWAAMLSLEGAKELVESTAHLEWQMPVRGRDNVALVERYGKDALQWIRTRSRHGVLINHPWCVVPSILAIDDAAALELLLSVDGVAIDAGDMKYWQFTPADLSGREEEHRRGALDMVLEWTRLHPDVGFPLLARHARNNARAAEALRKIALVAPGVVKSRLERAGELQLATDLGLPLQLTAESILAPLDQACSGQGNGWPWFVQGVDGRTEYFDLRLVAVRATTGDGWAIVLERLQGCDPDSFQVNRYAYGPGTVNGSDFDHSHFLESDFDIECEEDAPVFHGGIAHGPAGDLTLDESLFAKHDLRPGTSCEFGGWPARTLAVRAYLAEHGNVFFPPPEEALAAANVEGSEVFLVSHAFAHVSGNPMPDHEPKPWHVLPSQSKAYRSLAEALVARDPSLFEPGDSNLHWSLHSESEDEFPLPWTKHRASTDEGYLRAAMEETGAELDERKLLPLAEARAIVSAAGSLARGGGRAIGDRWVWDLDRTWAALLSLESAEEAARAFARLELVDPPRDAAKNVALVERYGDGALQLVAARAGEGVVVDAPAWLRTTVLGVSTPAGFRFVWDLGGYREAGAEGSPDEQATALFAAWMSAHPAVGYVELAKLAESGDANAASFLASWAAPQVRKVFAWVRDGLGDERARALFAKLGLSVTLVPAHVLALVDSMAARADDDAWPLFRTGNGPSREYHALRLVAARAAASEEYVIVLERFEGYGASCSVRRYVLAEHLPSGLRRDLDVTFPDALRAKLETAAAREEDARLIEPPDYWTNVDGAPRQIAAIRAVLREHPNDVWPDARALLRTLGFSGDPLVCATAFAHTEGPTRDADPPSALRSYVSLAAAIVANDASLFVPGPSNLDVALHLQDDEEEEEEEEDGDE